MSFACLNMPLSPKFTLYNIRGILFQERLNIHLLLQLLSAFQFKWPLYSNRLTRRDHPLQSIAYLPSHTLQRNRPHMLRTRSHSLIESVLHPLCQRLQHPFSARNLNLSLAASTRLKMKCWWHGTIPESIDCPTEGSSPPLSLHSPFSICTRRVKQSHFIRIRAVLVRSLASLSRFVI